METVRVELLNSAGSMGELHFQVNACFNGSSTVLYQAEDNCIYDCPESWKNRPLSKVVQIFACLPTHTVNRTLF